MGGGGGGGGGVRKVYIQFFFLLEADLVFDGGYHSLVSPVNCRGRGFVGGDTLPGWHVGSGAVLEAT